MFPPSSPTNSGLCSLAARGTAASRDGVGKHSQPRETAVTAVVVARMTSTATIACPSTYFCARSARQSIITVGGMTEVSSPSDVIRPRLPAVIVPSQMRLSASLDGRSQHAAILRDARCIGEPRGRSDQEVQTGWVYWVFRRPRYEARMPWRNDLRNGY